ncbi:hypothetical protein ONR75_15905 [Rhodopseudomonas sp. P2A-2r]|uniref:hypothetical protein n=1 Tax=Rhodopseudomonas sp. P2A-2r TaxID=2991972 RepID=UPI0022347AAB|nr:hypothetical protein [Rhodopseudomonas sp. P2A-2r]UZE51915.1 hypothetical protein ONR75_15905 [Rhodopseudomonas sp. P2A-2r]
MIQAPTAAAPLPAPPMAAPDMAPQPSPASDLSSVNRTPPAIAPAASAVAPGAPAVAAPPMDAPPAAAPAQSAPFSLAGAGDGFGDRLMKGATGFIGNLHNGPIGALAGGLGALVTGRSTDAGSIEAEKLAATTNATARALVSKGASPEDVLAASKNPALMTALVQQYYGKDKWGVVQVGEDGDGRKQYMQQNQVDGTLRPIAGATAAAGGGEASNFVTGPDGKQIPIPPGVNRKEFIKKVSDASADAATGKGTEAQTKAAAFATRMTQAQNLLAPLEQQGTGFFAKIGDMVPGGNYLQSPEYQRYKQASSAFITAMLRQESGAAINKDEFTRYERELFPQPGDGPGVIAQKAAARAAATEQMQRSAGSMFHAPAAAAAPAPVAPPAAGARLQPGQSATIGNISIKRVN